MPNHRHEVAECESFAEGNDGIIPRQVALTAGLDDSAISRVLAAGRWQRAQPRAYRVAGSPVTWRSELAAVVASVRGEFAFSHTTAGALIGLDEVPQDRIEIITPNAPRLIGVAVHRVNQMPNGIVRAQGFPVTSVHRTILDLFSALPHPKAELALDDALRKRLTTIERVVAEYANTCRRGRNGCKAFRKALLFRDDRDGTLQSRMEAKLRRIIKQVRGAEAIPQFEVHTPQGRYYIDFAYPDVKLGIEAQSIKWHMGVPKFYSDLKRDRHLKLSGWTMAYYSWDDLLDPIAVRNEINELRGSLAHVLL